MTNKEIAKSFSLLGDLMELHKENPFKVKSYQSAYIILRKMDEPLEEMNIAELEAIKGIGKAIAEKIRELVSTGKMTLLEKFREKTPPGVIEMLQLPGFGPKKVYQIWQDLQVESIGELWYACNENRLTELSGFGTKTQEDLKKKIEYFQKSRNKKLFADIEPSIDRILEKLKTVLPDAKIETTGAIRRLNPTIERLEFIIGTDKSIDLLFTDDFLVLESSKDDTYLAKTAIDELPVCIYLCKPGEFGSKQFLHTASAGFLDIFINKNIGLEFKGIETEEAVFEKAGWKFIAPELREPIHDDFTALAEAKLITDADIRGVVHTHTTYSDGLHDLREMVYHAQSLNYEYIVISDHSQSAFYANGLNPERVMQQMAEIDALNKGMRDFKIFKSIESDILFDGRLDYRPELLSQFDLVIASVHSNLKMDNDKATSRIIKAIENPYTSILGHPTGRLLLSRQGYPVNIRKIIDACAANGVAIELNANPWRLDLDWSCIPMALQKGVLISINPDAHSKEGIRDIHYGILAARKGGLTKENCLNALSAEDFEKFCNKRKI